MRAFDLRRPWVAAARRQTAANQPQSRLARARRSLGALNVPLLVGAAIWLVLYALAVYGPALAPHDQYFTVASIGNATPPFPPGPVFPFGSDQLGHDVLSWLLIGARPTLLLAVGAALLRAAIALSLGLLTGWRVDSVADRGLGGLASAAAALPAVVGAMLALLIVGPSRGWVAFAVALTAFGWAAPALLVRRATADVTVQDYVAAAHSLGAGERRLLLRHVLPNALPAALPALVLQAAACLLLLAELGFLQLFLGGGSVVASLELPRRVPDQAEWGGLLSQNQPLGLLFFAPWIVLAPVACIAAASLGTAVLAAGLARATRRRALGQLFPARRALVAAAILAVLAVPGLHRAPPDPAAVRWADTFDAAQAAADEAALAAPAFGGRAAGSAGAAAAAYWLVARFGDLGLRPAGAAGYTRPVPLPGLLPNGRPAVTLKRGTAEQLFGPPEVAPLALPWSAGGEATGPLLFVGRPGVPHPGVRPRPGAFLPDFTGKVVVLAPPTATFPVRTMALALDTVANAGAAAAIILDDGPSAPYAALGPPGSAGLGSRRLPILKVSGQAARALLAGSGITPETAATVGDDSAFTPVALQGEARVVSGFSPRPPMGLEVAALLPGTAPTAPLLVVAASYDSNGADGDGSGIAVLLEVARMLRAHPLGPETLFLALPGGPPGDLAMEAALAAPPLVSRPVLLALRLDDLGGGGPLSLGAYSPSFQATELAVAAGRAAGDVGAPSTAVTPALNGRVAGPVSAEAFTPSGQGQPLQGPAVTIAARSGRGRPPDQAALAHAGRTAALLLARAAAGGDEDAPP